MEGDWKICDIWSAAPGCLKVKVKYNNKNMRLRLEDFIQQIYNI